MTAQVRYDRVRRHATLRCAFALRIALHLITHLRFVNTGPLKDSADSKVCYFVCITHLEILLIYTVCILHMAWTEGAREKDYLACGNGKLGLYAHACAQDHMDKT